MNKKEYIEYVESKSPKSPLVKDMIKAFLIGGAICTIGEGFLKLYEYLGCDTETASTLVAVTLIFLGMLLTGLGWYGKIAKHAGAGTLVPITGFANAVASSAIEAKTEGYCTGVGAKLFTIAGPVIVFGITASAIAGVVYYFFM